MEDINAKVVEQKKIKIILDFELRTGSEREETLIQYYEDQKTWKGNYDINRNKIEFHKYKS